MGDRVNKVIAPFYCQIALGLCVQARELCTTGECQKASEICGFISSLCAKSDAAPCGHESSVCRTVSLSCQATRQGSEVCKKAGLACREARQVCPHNFQIHGG